MSKDGPSNLHTTVGVSPMVRALQPTSDLEKHIVFIRRSLAAGITAAEIGQKLGVKASRIAYFARSRGMFRNSRTRHSLYLPKSDKCPGTGPIAAAKFKAREL